MMRFRVFQEVNSRYNAISTVTEVSKSVPKPQRHENHYPSWATIAAMADAFGYDVGRA